MSDCQHPNVAITYSVMAYVDSEARTAHINARCADCGVRFRFLGNMPIRPPTALEALEAKAGPWVSPEGDEIGCLISAMRPDDHLETVAVKGRA